MYWLTVALFFPHTIRQGITGSENFVFSYNREKQQYFGLLQAQPGVESNLLAITDDGQVYAYILKYADSIPKLNYFISASQSIGREKPSQKKDVYLKDTTIEKASHSIDYYKAYSEYLFGIAHKTISRKRKGGLVLRLEKLTYHQDEVYLVLNIKNNSGIDFEMDDLFIHIVSSTKNNKSSYQELEQKIVYTYNFPKRIKDGTKKRFVCVLPKFVLGEHEKLLVELKELHGNRAISVVAKK